MVGQIDSRNKLIELNNSTSMKSCSDFMLK